MFCSSLHEIADRLLFALLIRINIVRGRDNKYRMKTHVNTVESSTKLPKSHYYIFKSNQTLFKPKFTKTNVIYFNQSLVSQIES